MLWPAVVTVPVVALTAAADVTEGIDPTTLVGQISSGLGLATFAWLFVTGRIVSKGEHERVIAANTELQTIVLQRVIPALTRISDYLQDEEDDHAPRPPRRRN